MPLYEFTGDGVRQIRSGRFALERELQNLVEANLEDLLGVRFIASEFSTGSRQRGRIDTLGLDLNGAPTIIEYKRSQNDNVINQGLFYLDWLVDHKGDFVLAAQETLGIEIDVNWDNPRLILIAQSFNEYDKYAVNRIGVNVELYIYRLYGESLLYMEQIYAHSPRSQSHRQEAVQAVEADLEQAEADIVAPPAYTLESHLAKTRPEIREAFHALRERIFELASSEDEIIETPNKLYVAYRRGKNFAEVVFQNKALRIFLDISPDEVHDPGGLVRDVSDVGHWGTGNTEVRVERIEDVNSVFYLVEEAYQLTL